MPAVVISTIALAQGRGLGYATGVGPIGLDPIRVGLMSVGGSRALEPVGLSIFCLYAVPAHV